MPKTKERPLFINFPESSVDTTIAGAVLIKQYHQMYLLGAPVGSYSAVFAKGLTWKGGGLGRSCWVTRISKADNRKLQRNLTEIISSSAIHYPK